MEQVQGEQYKDPQELEPVELSMEGDHLLHCPSCNCLIKADDINIQKLVAKCGNCNHVFPFGHSVSREMTGYSRPDMLIPDGMEVLKLQDELDIQVNWFQSLPRSSMTFTIVFTLIWNLILLPFILMAIFTGQWGILLFTSVHLLVGIGFIMRLLAVFLNTTSVNVSRRYLVINTSPIPSLFRKNRKIPTEQVQQLYVTKYVESRTNNNPNYAYGLYAILNGGQKITLAKGLNKEAQQYLEYEIESFLGIRDRKVKGELKKA